MEFNSAITDIVVSQQKNYITIVVYLGCKQYKIETFSDKSCFAANQRKRSSVRTGQVHRYLLQCKIQWYTIFMLLLILLGKFFLLLQKLEN